MDLVSVAAVLTALSVGAAGPAGHVRPHADSHTSTLRSRLAGEQVETFHAGWSGRGVASRYHLSGLSLSDETTHAHAYLSLEHTERQMPPRRHGCVTFTLDARDQGPGAEVEGTVTMWHQDRGYRPVPIRLPIAARPIGDAAFVDDTLLLSTDHLRASERSWFTVDLTVTDVVDHASLDIRPSTRPCPTT